MMSAQGDDLAANGIDGLLGALLCLPRLNQSVSAGNALDEGFWPHRSGNAESAKVVGKVEEIVTVFEARDVLANEYSAFRNFLTQRHNKPSLVTGSPEQLGIGTYPCFLGNELTAVIDEPLSNSRQTDVAMSREGMAA